MTEQKGSSSHVPEPSGAVSALDCSLADLYSERKKIILFFLKGHWYLDSLFYVPEVNPDKCPERKNRQKAKGNGTQKNETKGTEKK